MDQKPYSGRRLSALKGIVGTAEIRRMVQTACCGKRRVQQYNADCGTDGKLSKWYYRRMEYLPNNPFEKVVSFLVEKESVEEMRASIFPKHWNPPGKNAQNNQWNGWFEETNWNKWQEHMESLIETMRKILEQDGEDAGLDTTDKTRDFRGTHRRWYEHGITESEGDEKYVWLGLCRRRCAGSVL
ncbi:MAG: hypothetical protein ACLTW9_22290 [Enterocloster sp.]